ncbi:hypothetical protein [Alkalihalobacillus deserti]|uniref:hypothetical protein n=1 Tax=Alkalihalobacillus deserti TaxID=2879466 RepID=UPI001D1571E7|nr:hypothetical protein [Alkalihalobacillus deserti]
MNSDAYKQEVIENLKDVENAVQASMISFTETDLTFKQIAENIPQINSHNHKKGQIRALILRFNSDNHKKKQIRALILCFNSDNHKKGKFGL